MAPLHAAARAALGSFSADTWTEDPELLATYGRDWTRVLPARPAVLVRPRSVDEVAALLRLARAQGLAVVPSGGRTGLAGGAVAAHGEMVLALERLAGLGPVDALGRTVRVGAGAITAAVHAHVAPAGLSWPVDFASKGSSQVGGNISTNAGGVRVLRYGLTRAWVMGLQVVLADGEVLALGGALEKDNTGQDLRQLFIGSEGTLGVITAATLRLARLPPPSQVALWACQGLAAVLELFAAARHGPFSLCAYEFFDAACVARVAAHRRLRPPLQAAPYYVLMEVDGHAEATLHAWAAAQLAAGTAVDAVLAASAAQAAELWALRENISASLAATGLPHKNDIALPLAALQPFCAALHALFAAEYPGWEVCLFGHVGDGNLHVNVMRPEALAVADFHARTAQADHAMFALVRAHGGSISAEHGIGLLKRDYLHYTRGPAERALMQRMKDLLDPTGMLNPGKILRGAAPQ